MSTPTAYAKQLAERGGMACCGAGLGVMVGPDDKACPIGWVFVQLPADPEVVQEAMEFAKGGRPSWPDKVDESGKSLGKPGTRGPFAVKL